MIEETEKYAELIARINRNYDDFMASLPSQSKQGLIDMANKIASTGYAHEYLTAMHGYDEADVDFFLRFQNPLEVVAREWGVRSSNIEDMIYTIERDINENQAHLLTQYPLMSDKPPEQGAVNNPAMPELKQHLLKYELARAGFPKAQYDSESGRIYVDPGNERMPGICDNGDVYYNAEYRDLALNTVRPLANKVNEVIGAWDRASPLDYEGVPEFRKLAEYGKTVLAARDDSGYGHGLHFVTWEYNFDRTGFNHGHYTTDYEAAKEDFAVRAGLMPKAKVFTPEQAAEVRNAVEFTINNNGALKSDTETTLKDISAKITAEYGLPSVDTTQSAELVLKPKLDDLLGAADKKIKTQDAHKSDKPRSKREERS